MGTNLIACILLLFCGLVFGQDLEKDRINNVLDSWHQAAAEANYENYFGRMTDDGVFLGTDATENWQNKEFRTYAKPHFDKGRAWSFTALERNIYLNETKDFAWFDELLDTQMKICRGSGVLKKDADGNWKIAHYVLSITVPNQHVEQLVSIKNEADSILTKKLRKRL